MNDIKEFKEKIKKMKDESIIAVESWYGCFDLSGWGGTIVTKDREVYVYYNCYNYTNGQENTDILKKKDLNDKDFQNIDIFIEKEIKDKDWNNNSIIFDQGYEILINYKGIKRTIINNIEIYEKMENLLRDLVK